MSSCPHDRVKSSPDASWCHGCGARWPARPTETELLLDIAAQVARRSTCSRLAVGAVLARDGRILSTGRNGAPSGLPHCDHTLDSHSPCTTSVHAEVNAIAFAARHGASSDGATLYLTHAPCVACAGIIINSGVASVVYSQPYRDDSGCNRLALGGVECVHHTD